MSKRTLVIAAVFFASVARASQPGLPLDCTDWAFLEPGHTCTVVVATPGDGATGGSVDQEFFRFGGNKIVDNTGAMILIRTVFTPPGGNLALAHGRTEVVRMANGAQSVVAYIEDRESGVADRIRSVESYCTGGDNCYGYNNWLGNVISFDAVNGRLLIPLQSFCRDLDYGSPPDCPQQYGGGYSIMALQGFPTLFEILQSYTPTATDLQFRVPAHPEGLRSADHFDTYWGRVSDLPDFTQAQPMQCHYPATQPSVGDYLTVASVV